jgi:hypothetical protein
MFRTRFLVLCILVLGLLPKPSGAVEWNNANPFTATPDAWAVPDTGPWYGYQTLLVDASALTIGAVAFSHRGDLHADRMGSMALTLGLIAGATYLLGPPAVHVLHGRTPEAASSLTLRVGLPAVAAAASFVLLAFGLGGCTACVYAMPVVGGAAVVTPIVIDALSRDRYAAPRGFAFSF